jgi:hypothetical protein
MKLLSSLSFPFCSNFNSVCCGLLLTLQLDRVTMIKQLIVFMTVFFFN